MTTGDCRDCAYLTEVFRRPERCRAHLAATSRARYAIAGALTPKGRALVLAHLRAYLLRLDTLTGLVTIVAMILIGEKYAAGWALAIANQGLWIVLIQRRKLWGLLPLSGALTGVYSHALWKWLG